MASTLTVKDMNQEIVRDCMKGLGPVKQKCSLPENRPELSHSQ